MGGSVKIERRTRRSGPVEAYEVEALDGKPNCSSATIAFKTDDLDQVLGQDEVAKVAGDRWTFDANTNRRNASENAEDLNPSAVER